MRNSVAIVVRLRTIGLALAVCGITNVGTPRRAGAADQATVRFESHIAPLLETRCLSCHGDGKLEAGLNVRRRSLLLKGGDSGPAIVPGKPAESLLVQRVEKGEMPPKGEDPLTEAQKSLLRSWIEAGAPLVAAQEPPLDETEAASRLSDEDRQFWSFRAPVRRMPPPVAQAERVRTPVDNWIAAAQEARGLTFNPDAPREALVRRLTIALTGLNPTLDEVDDFLSSDGPDVVERLVDRLLASPAYGQRWGRHWLDLAGYADSDGYLAADRVRPEAWRYRDYVIQALNDDLPYDQFIREQLAGDELSTWRQADELTPEITRQLVATGFLRTASDPTYPGYTEPNEIHQVISDTMQIFGSTFLGLTIQCARCHAHKFDPLSQRDYYGLQTIFLPALDPARWQPSEVRGIPLATDKQLAQINQANQQADQRLAELNQTLADLTARFRQQRIREALTQLTNDIADPFQAETLDSRWLIQLSGTAKTWRHAQSDGWLRIQAIEGGQGYALVRFSRPVILAGEFTASLRLQWTSQEGPPEKNAAMQGIQLNLRDAGGNIVASCGYIDENNTARGSPICGIAAQPADIGPDLIAHYMKRFQQAVPPSDKARALGPAGDARVTIRRDEAGRVHASFQGDRIQDELVLESRTPVTSVEIEFRRYVLQPGATFDGIAVADFRLQPGPGSQLDPQQIAQLEAALAQPEKARSDEQKQLVARLAPAIPASEADLSANYPEYRAEVARLRQSMAAETATKQTVTRLRGLMNLEGPTPAGHILRRGDHSKPGAEVLPAVPEILDLPGSAFAAPTSPAGRRQALAEWLVRPDHPLTGRVQMNRLWARLFGRGLVATPANFGRSGAKPTHPELLDWLAAELPRRAWSVKEMQRLLLTSTVYRQSSALTADQATNDPQNSWWSAYQPRRHDGEVVRDNTLFVAGKLNQIQGGPPSAVAPQGDGSVLTADDAAGNRRSIYLIVRRSQHLTMLDLFDTPTMEVNCPERNTSTVPLQALALLHGPFTQQAATALGQRLWDAASDDEVRFDVAFRLLYSRSPRAHERSELREFLAAVTRDLLAGRAGTAGDPETDQARRAAWKELALTLLNSNEFLYVH